MHFLLFFGLRVGWWCWSSWRCQRRMSAWVGARITKVTLLSIIVALSVSSDLVHIRSGLRSVGCGVGVGHWYRLGHQLAKWPTCPQLKHVVVTLADVEPSLWLGVAFLVMLISCALPESSWVLLFLFLDEGLTSIDYISWLTSCIWTRICRIVWRSWFWMINNCLSIEGGLSMLLLSSLLDL
jgi:hypothetical protein